MWHAQIRPNVSDSDAMRMGGLKIAAVIKRCIVVPLLSSIGYIISELNRWNFFGLSKDMKWGQMLPSFRPQEFKQGFSLQVYSSQQ